MIFPLNGKMEKKSKTSAMRGILMALFKSFRFTNGHREHYEMKRTRVDDGM